jgi:hypothetical protein
MTTAPSLKDLSFTGPVPMRASDRPRTLYARHRHHETWIPAMCDADEDDSGIGVDPIARRAVAAEPSFLAEEEAIAEDILLTDHSPSPGLGSPHARRAERTAGR